jgi:hypothetical protein
MKGDFTRLAADFTKHFRQVLFQQGRVPLDADWNEQSSILLHYLQALAKDLIGDHGGPKDNCGFETKPIEIEGINDDFEVGFGHYYVDGILGELDAQEIPIKLEQENGAKNKIRVVSLTVNNNPLKKGHYLKLYDIDKNTQTVKIDKIYTEKLEIEVTKITIGSPISARLVTTYLTQDDYPHNHHNDFTNGNYLVYLDVWEHLITAVEDESIREVALGGPDTAARSKLVYQVKV